MKGRYFRFTSSGSDKNEGNHYVEIQIYDKDGINRALNRGIYQHSSEYNDSDGVVTDGEYSDATKHYWPGEGTHWLTIDLGAIYDIQYIKIWRYYADNRIYKGVLVEVSTDDVNYKTVFSSEQNGTYAETSDGYQIDLPESKKYYYNGNLLPEIPADVQYEYLMIVSAAENNYVLISTSGKYYVKDGMLKCQDNITVWTRFYRCTDGENWVFQHTKIYEYDASIYKWSNYDIPKDSYASSVIYFNGSEPVLYEEPEEEEPSVVDGYIMDSWEEINAKCASGEYATTYSLGDKKIVTLTWPDGTTEENELELVDIDHDDLADGSGKASLTFITRYLIEQTKKMSSSNTNSGGWAGQYSLRSWCNGDLYNALPIDLRNVVKIVKKLSDGGYNSKSLVETHDKVWIPSMAETAFEELIPTVAGQGYKYAYISRFDNDEISWRGKYTGEASNYTRRYWWSRTSKTDTTTNWGMNGMWGGFSHNSATASDMGVAFGLCVGAVGDEPKESIYYKMTITNFGRGGVGNKTFASVAEFALYNSNDVNIARLDGAIYSASSEVEGGEASLAFDGIADTNWHSDWTNAVNTTHWLEVCVPSSDEVFSFGITPRVGTLEDFAYDFTLDVSTDGSSWNNLFTAENLSDGWSSGVERKFVIKEPEEPENPPKTIGYLIREEATIYTVNDDALVMLSETELTAELFESYAVDELPSASLLQTLNNPEILYWNADTEESVSLVAVVKAVPLPQTLTSHENNFNVKSARCKASNDVLFAVSFNSGDTWLGFVEGAWSIVQNPVMSADVINAITNEQWALVSNTGKCRFKITIPKNTSYFCGLSVECLN